MTLLSHENKCDVVRKITNGCFKSATSQTNLSVNGNISFMKMLKSNRRNTELYGIIWGTSIIITNFSYLFESQLIYLKFMIKQRHLYSGSIITHLIWLYEDYTWIIWKDLLDLLGLVAQVMSTPCTSETILPPSTSLLCISFISQDGIACISFDEIYSSFWWSSSWSWMREILFVRLI